MGAERQRTGDSGTAASGVVGHWLLILHPAERPGGGAGAPALDEPFLLLDRVAHS